MTSQEFYSLLCKHLPRHYTEWINARDKYHLRDSVETNGQVAYSPEGVAADDDKKRRKTTLGRFMVRTLGMTLTPELEKGIALVLAEMANEWKEGNGPEFEVLRGDAVTQAYINGVGSNSCMTGDCQSHITSFYSIFPEKIGLVVWRKNKGRALLWTMDDGSLSLDRIYAGDTVQAKIRYASWMETNEVEERVDGTITLGPKAVDGRPVPYMDTYYYATDKGVLSQHSKGHAYTLQDTEGNCIGGEVCESCERRCDEVHPVGNAYYCDHCREEYAMYCERCDEYSHCDDFTEVDGNYICDGCAERAERCNECSNRTFESVQLEGQSYCQECILEVCSVCEKCDSETHSSDTVECGDEHYCADCAEEWQAAEDAKCAGCREGQVELFCTCEPVAA